MLPSEVRAHLARQGGVAGVRHLLQLSGVTRSDIESWRRRGWLHAVSYGVVAAPGAPRTPERLLWEAVLSCGDQARAGGAASCWAHGLEGFSRLRVGVVVPSPRRCRGKPFPVNSRVLDQVDHAAVRGLPVLSAARAIVEVAGELSDKQLRVLIDSAQRKRLLSLELLRRRALALLHERGMRRNALRVLRLIGDGTFEQETELERAIEEFLATTTLVLEWQVEDVVPGRRLDAYDRQAEMSLEIDSRAFHTLSTDRDNDGLRDLEIAEHGIIVFHLTGGMVRFAPDETRRRLDRIRAQRVAERSTTPSLGRNS